MQEVLEASLAQFHVGAMAPPRVVAMPELGAKWRRAWYEIVVGRRWSDEGGRVDRDVIRRRLAHIASEP